MLYVGIDPSAKKIAIVATHAVLRVSHVKSYVLYKAPKTQTPESMGRALDVMYEFVEWVDQVAPQGERYAWVERPLVGRGGTETTIKQAYVGGIIRAVLVNAGFHVESVHPSTWKSKVIGHGGADKAAIQTFVKRSWPKIAPQIGSDGDLADAAAIAIYGRGVLDRQTRLDAGLDGSKVSR